MVLSHIIIFASKVYDKQYYFNFEIVILPFLDGNVPCSSSYSVYILQLSRFEMVSSNVDDFNKGNSFYFYVIKTR